MIYVFVSGMINVYNEFNQTKRSVKMGFKEGWNNVCNWGSDFCTWLISGRGVDYQFICKLYKEDFYGKNNDFQIFKPLNATTENNLKENFKGGASPVTSESAFCSLPVLHWLFNEDYDKDSFTLTSNAAGYILKEMKTWDQMDNEQKKHVLSTTKKWYQQSRTDDKNANDYLCAADRVMYYMNVGAGTSIDNDISVGGFREQIRKMDADFKPSMTDYKPAYVEGFDPIKYIEELEKEIAQEEKGKTGPGSDKKPTIKEVPDKLPDDKKPNDTKPEDKKPEDKKPNDKKTGDKKAEDKKPEDKKTGDKKAEDKKPEDKNSTEKDKKKIKLSPEKEKAVKESLEQWDKFMQEKGNDMLKKYREEKKAKSLAQTGVSAKGLTDHLKDGSEKQMTALHENAHELADTNTVTPVSESKSR